VGSSRSGCGRTAGCGALAERWYGYPREGRRFNRVFTHGRWLKLYDRFVRSVFVSCSESTIGLRVWKVRLDPEGIRDFGQQLVDRDLAVADRVLRRVAGGLDPKALATPAAVERARALLAGTDPTPTWHAYRVVHDGGTRVILLDLKLTDVVVTVSARPGGRRVVSDVRPASPDESAPPR
jgi:hypothetical protein